jgi:hypothetical protein
MSDNGFDQYKRLIEFRMDQADAQHAEVLSKIAMLDAKISKLELKQTGQTVGWSVLTSILVILAYVLLPQVVGGCG